MTDSLLRYAYVERRCNACGGSYRVTLEEMLKEHQVQSEWRSTRPCSVCSIENRPLMSAIPSELIADLSQAWERVAHAAEKVQFDLRVGV